MRHSRRSIRAAITVTAIATAALVCAAPSMAGDVVYGVTDNDALVTFDSDRPGTQTTVPLGGGFTPASEDIEAIDFRPATGGLYALIRITAPDTYEVRRIIPQNGSVADLPAPPVPLAGDDFGFDFNPTVDRIRVHSRTGTNGRFDPNTGALTPDPNLDDGGVTASAYSQNFPRGLDGDTSSAPATQLYGIDVSEDRVVTMQEPSPTFEMVTDRGPLGVDAAGDVGFDISQRGDALAAIRVGAAGPVKLFRIERDLPSTATEPAAKEVGTISATSAADKVHSIAIAPHLRNFATLLAPAAGDTRQRLGFFRGDLPEGLVNVRPIVEGDASRFDESLPAGVDLIGIDTRQHDGELYAAGSDSRLYELIYDEDPDEILVRQVSATAFPALSGTAFGLDFNPLADRLRIVSNAEQNLRINPADGTGLADSTLTGATSVTGAAYTNAFEGADNTTLLGINSDAAPASPDTLVRIGSVDGDPNSPNGGITTNVGSLGAPLGFPINLSDDLGFDIEPEHDLGYVAGQIPSTGSSDRFLVTVGGGNTVSEGVPVGRIGGSGTNTPTQGLAVLNNDLISLGSVSLLAPEDIPGGRLPVFVTRSGPADVPASVHFETIGLEGAGNPFDFGTPQQSPPTGGSPVPNTTVSFAPGETVKTVFIPIVNDTNPEGTELIAILLIDPEGGAAVGFPNQTIAAIPANDSSTTPTATPGVINGTPGNDTLNGTPGDDIINCGDGNDTVNGGGGDDVIRCGGGNDTVNGGGGSDRIDGEAGNDRLSGESGEDDIDGGSGTDRLGGGSGDDTLDGEGGNDRITANSGNDRATGGSGNDRLGGNAGDDRLSGNSGRDTASGNSGDERISGGTGNDNLSGNSGDDRISGNSGADRLRGGTGRDRLIGGPGRDRTRQS